MAILPEKIYMVSNPYDYLVTIPAKTLFVISYVSTGNSITLDNKDKYYENVNFKGWVFTIMHNIFVNNYRRIVRTQTVVDQTENLYHLNLPQDSGFDTPEGAYTIAEITKSINSFSDEYKVPFTMHVSGYKYEEIAQTLTLPIGTVKSRIFFARKRLQEMLKDYKFQDRE